jgi:REP element-mobilizing transposase RayT
MANTYTSLHYHVTFSTKNHERWITPDLEPRLWAYLAGIARDNRIVLLKIGGVEDHVHLLLGMPPIASKGIDDGQEKERGAPASFQGCERVDNTTWSQCTFITQIRQV